MAQQRGLGKTFSELLASMPPETRPPSEGPPRSELDGVHLRLDEMSAELRELRYLLEAILVAVEQAGLEPKLSTPEPPAPLPGPVMLAARSAAALVEGCCAAVSIPFALSRAVSEWLRGHDGS